jgi:phenylpropionate dioxygenase-like ring-hydroxylating dioxygenase large terminal subunit
MVFAYMGPKELQPPFPEFDYRHLPPENIYVSKFQLECNWLQATEGDFDPSHGNFLHSTLDNNRGNPGQRNSGGTVNNLTGIPNRNLLDQEVAFEEPFPFAVGNRRIRDGDFRSKTLIRDVDGAMMTVQRQNRADGKEMASMSLSFIMPVYCLFGGVTRPNHFGHNIRVPIDNTHMMFFRIRWSLQPMTQTDLVWYKQAGYAYPEMIPGTWKTKANVWNDYEVDRLGQKTFLYSGIKTFPLQDIAMMENQWGPLADRTKEHLVAMDYVMIYLRRKLLKAAKDFMKGIEPTEPWMPEVYRYHPASAEIVNGDYEKAIAEATERVKTSLLTDEQRGIVAPAIRA